MTCTCDYILPLFDTHTDTGAQTRLVETFRDRNKCVCMSLAQCSTEKKPSRKCIHPVILCVVYSSEHLFCLDDVCFFSFSLVCFKSQMHQLVEFIFFASQSVICMMTICSKHSAVLATLETGLPKHVFVLLCFFYLETGFCTFLASVNSIPIQLQSVFIPLISIEHNSIGHTPLAADCNSMIAATFQNWHMITLLRRFHFLWTNPIVWQPRSRLSLQ